MAHILRCAFYLPFAFCTIFSEKIVSMLCVLVFDMISSLYKRIFLENWYEQKHVDIRIWNKN